MTKNVVSVAGTFLALHLYCMSQSHDGNRAWGPEIEGFRLSIQTTKPSFACNEPINVSITFKNTGSTAGDIVTRQIPEIDYPAIVLLPSASWIPFRQRAPLTDEGRKRTDRKRIFSVVNFPLPADGERSCDLELGRIYDMRWPGEYSVTVSTEILNRGRKGNQMLTSNALRIEVRACKP